MTQIADADADVLAAQMLIDPIGFKDSMPGRTHKLARAQVEAIQLSALKQRFAQLRDQVPVLKRLAYAITGSDEAGLAKANAFGQMVYDALLALPETVSTKPKKYNADLRDQVDAVRLDGDWFNVIGGREGEGAVIVSQLPEPVNFSQALIDRTLNIVPLDNLDDVLPSVSAYTQTVGIYPESLKDSLLDVLPLYGAQRIVSLGYACAMSTMNSNAHDGIEPLRRMGRWIVNDSSHPEIVPAMWGGGEPASVSKSNEKDGL